MNIDRVFNLDTLNIYSNLIEYLIKAFQENERLKLKLVNHVFTENTNELPIDTSMYSDEYTHEKILYLFGMIILKTNLNSLYLKLIIGFLEIDILQLEDIINAPEFNNIKDFYLYLCNCLLNFIKSQSNEDSDNELNQINLSKSWVYVKANDYHDSTSISSNLPSLASSVQQLEVDEELSEQNKKPSRIKRFLTRLCCYWCCYCVYESPTSLSPQSPKSSI